MVTSIFFLTFTSVLEDLVLGNEELVKKVVEEVVVVDGKLSVPVVLIWGTEVLSLRVQADSVVLFEGSDQVIIE